MSTFKKWRLCSPDCVTPDSKSMRLSHCSVHTKIEYLGYILTKDGIKPQPKKVQAILTLNPPNNVKELRHFLGMVQYYRDM
jgi:hypothetical protein